MAPPPPTNAESTAKIQDNIAARVAGSLLGSEWKRNRERKKWLQRRTVLSDCRLMLRYALDEGCQISDELSKDIAKIDAALIQVSRDPLSEIPSELIQKAQSTAQDQQPQAQQGVAPQPGAKDQQPQAQQGAEPIPTPTPTPTSKSLSEVIMRVHNALSDLVAPATAQSLRATDPAIVSWGLPWIAKLAIFGALLSTVSFILAVSKPKMDSSGNTASGPPAQSPSPTATASASPFSQKL
jgi:hypothetical protein